MIKTKFSENEYKIATGRIKSKRQENVFLKNRFDSLGMKLEETHSIILKTPLEEEKDFIKRRIVNNQETIEFLNKKYFEGKIR